VSQSSEILKFNYIGDTHILTGEVVDKCREDARRPGGPGRADARTAPRNRGGAQGRRRGMCQRAAEPLPLSRSDDSLPILMLPSSSPNISEEECTDAAAQGTGRRRRDPLRHCRHGGSVERTPRLGVRDIPHGRAGVVSRERRPVTLTQIAAAPRLAVPGTSAECPGRRQLVLGLVGVTPAPPFHLVLGGVEVVLTPVGAPRPPCPVPSPAAR